MSQPSDNTLSLRDYCKTRQQTRPRLHLLKWALEIVFVEILIISAAWLCCQMAGISFVLCCEIANILIFIIFGKWIIRRMILIYQHYASEDTRRQCTCIPSCSEYALIALDKFFLFKAIYKIWRRVTHTCAQPGYKIDYP